MTNPVLVLPTRNPLAPAYKAVLDAATSPNTRRAYRRILDEFLDWLDTLPFNRATALAYRAELVATGNSPASINQSLSGIRRLAQEAEAAGIIDAGQCAGIVNVKGERQLGTHLGHWLTREQAQELVSLPNPETLGGKRDRVIFGLLLGCGLRRSEAAHLRYESLQQREGRWVLVDILGKGRRVRSVPTPRWVYLAIEQWKEASGVVDGNILRPVSKGGKLSGDSMTPSAIWAIVRRYALRIGQPDLAPHDLRRTWAQLARRGGAQLEQIQLALGHSSVQTTERYLGGKLDLEHAACDVTGVMG